MPAYTFSQSISLNSFHSVAITTASASLHASMAELHIVTCFLTERKVLVSENKTFLKNALVSKGTRGLASARSSQI